MPRVPPVLKPALGGLAVGGAAILLPQVLGNGYPALGAALRGELPFYLLALLVLFKMGATATTLGSGGSGGDHRAQPLHRGDAGWSDGLDPPSNAPLAGTLFSLEVVLGEMSPSRPALPPLPMEMALAGRPRLAPLLRAHRPSRLRRPCGARRRAGDGRLHRPASSCLLALPCRAQGPARHYRRAIAPASAPCRGPRRLAHRPPGSLLSERGQGARGARGNGEPTAPYLEKSPRKSSRRCTPRVGTLRPL